MYKLTSKTLLDRIVESETSKEYTYIITGKVGPTGKSWLCRELKSRGYNALEINESLTAFCHMEFHDDYNHYIINEREKLMIIILNESVR